MVVLDPDPRAAKQLQFGFRRESVPTRLEIEGEVGIVIVGGDDLGMITAARAKLEAKQQDAIVLYTGNAARATAEAAGADEVLDHPAYLRDVVTIGRLLRDVAPEARGHIVGSLGDLTNVLTLVRSLSSLGRSASLTLMRGLRRGEVRFFRGEVTSAQVGLIHGQAALHQLLLWTDARFDFHHEDVVRRQQIPMTPDEVFVDAERFLEGIRDSSGMLSPAMVLEQDVQRVHNLGKQIPTEVHGVLRMFDGHRVLADVLEDSPYRVFETLRVAQRAVEAGLLRIVKSQRPKATWRAVLAIDEWLVSTEQRAPGKDDDTEQEPSPADSGPALAKLPAKKKSRRNRKHRRANTPLPIPVKPQPVLPSSSSIDWGALVPRTIGSDAGSLSTVVPAAALSGEIRMPTRELEREKLEALMDTGKRDKIFPHELDQPSVVFDDRSGPIPAAVAPETVSAGAMSAADQIAIPRTASAQFRDDSQDKVKSLVAAQAKERLELEARSARSSNVREPLAAEITARAAVNSGDTAPIPKAELDAIVGGDSEQLEVIDRKPRAARHDDSHSEATDAKRAEDALRNAEAKALADAFAGRKTPPPSELAAAVPSTAADLVRDLISDAASGDESQVRARRTKATSIPPHVDDEPSHPLAALPVKRERTSPRGSQEPLAAAAGVVDTTAHDAAQVAAEVAAATKAAEEAKADAEAAKLDAKVAEDERAAQAAAEAAKVEAAKVAEAKAAADAEAAKLDAKRTEDERAAQAAAEAAKVEAAKVEAAEAKAAAEAEAAKLDAKRTEDERAAQVAAEEAASSAAAKLAADAEAAKSATAAAEEPIRAAKAALEAKQASAAVDEDALTRPVEKIAPEAPEPTSEPIPAPVAGEKSNGRSKRHSSQANRKKQKTAPPVEARTKTPTAPPVLVERKSQQQLPQKKPSSPNIANIATSAAAKAVDDLRKDATALSEFSDDEEAFFRGGESEHALPAVRGPIAAETFDDLDEGYQPVGFWDRLLGRKPDKPKKK